MSVERPVTPLHASFLGSYLRYFELVLDSGVSLSPELRNGVGVNLAFVEIDGYPPRELLEYAVGDGLSDAVAI